MSHTTTRSYHLSGSEKFAVFPLEWMPLMPNPRALRVFLALIAHADQNGRCYPSVETLAALACVHRSHVPPSLRALEKVGAIRTVRMPGKSSRYHVMPPPVQTSMPPPEVVISNLDTSPNRVVLSKTDRGVISNLDTPPLSKTDTLSNHVSRPFKKPTAPRAATTALKEPTDGEREVLETCLEWERGNSIPLAAHLVELYRRMKPALDLPSRPRA